MRRSRAEVGVFLCVVMGLFLLVDVVIYAAAALAFNIEGSQSFWLGALLVALSASFIGASVLGNRYYNYFTRACYTVSAVWIGSTFYFFIVSLGYGLLVFASPASTIIALGPFLFLLALAVSVYGVLHARATVVKNVSITLPNLPPAWRGKKAVWISDLHLGQVYGARFAKKIAARVSALAPDIVFIGGDLYDGTSAPGVVAAAAPLKALHAPFGTYFIAGNHEEYGDRAQFLSAVESAGVRVLNDEMVDIGGIQLLGVDYQNASDADRFAAILSKLSIDPHKLSILLKHEPKDLGIAQAAGVSLQISGHTHKAQLWPLEYIAQRLYKGFVYGHKTYKGMQVYTSSGVGTWGPPLRVGTDGELVLFTFD